VVSAADSLVTNIELNLFQMQVIYCITYYALKGSDDSA
jgi:hypothetical protein